MLVKLYPYDRRMGWIIRSYTITDGNRSTRFQGQRGWYEVDLEVANRLRLVPQEQRYPVESGGKPAFMIAETPAMANEMDEKLTAMRSKSVDELVGTVDAPVRAMRPGAVKDPVPRTRRRKPPE